MKDARNTRLRAQKISGPGRWLRVYMLYRTAFPRCERKPFSRILSMYHRGRTDLWYFGDENGFAGFAATINDHDLILLDYLAVPKHRRGEGCGTAILQELKTIYPNRGLFVEIESPFEDAPNREERMSRRRFYMASGLMPARVMANVFDVKMELLCWNCHVGFHRYHDFYRDNLSPWAAEHILPEPHPEA